MDHVRIKHKQTKAELVESINRGEAMRGQLERVVHENVDFNFQHPFHPVNGLYLHIHTKAHVFDRQTTELSRIPSENDASFQQPYLGYDMRDVAARLTPREQVTWYESRHTQQVSMVQPQTDPIQATAEPQPRHSSTFPTIANQAGTPSEAHAREARVYHERRIGELLRNYRYQARTPYPMPPDNNLQQRDARSQLQTQIECAEQDLKDMLNEADIMRIGEMYNLRQQE